MKERQSNIELLRCFAMLCIIVYHLLIFVVSPLHQGESLYQALQIPLHIGVPLFVLISGYFGIRFSLRGLMRLCSKGYVYLVPFLAVPAIINGQGLKEVLKNVFIFGFDALWYLNTYLYLFLFSPIVNRYLVNITRNQRLYLLFILAFMSIYIGNVTEGDIYLVEGKNLTNFILLYVIGNTIRHEQARIESFSKSKMLGGYLFFNVLLVLGFMFVPFLAGKIWKYSFAYDSPVIMINSIWVFALFSRLKFKSHFVNWMGGSIFACYLLQCPGVIWHNCFEYPIHIINGFVQSPILLILVLIIFALGTMLIMASIDKVLSPLWNRLVAFAAKYDEKWNTKQLW